MKNRHRPTRSPPTYVSVLLSDELGSRFGKFADALKEGTSVQTVSELFERYCSFITDNTFGMKNSPKKAIAAWFRLTGRFRKILPFLTALNKIKEDALKNKKLVTPEMEVRLREMDSAIGTLYLSDLNTLGQMFLANALNYHYDIQREIEIKKAESGAGLLEELTKSKDDDRRPQHRSKSRYEPQETDIDE